MTEVILGQLQFIIFMMCGGMGLMLGYDGLRLIRWLVPHGRPLIVIQDLLYWAVMSIPAFALFFYLHDGQIRWYGLTALFGGIALYEFGISSPVRRVLSRKLDPLRHRIRTGAGNVVRTIGRRWKRWRRIAVAQKRKKDKKITRKIL